MNEPILHEVDILPVADRWIHGYRVSLVRVRRNCQWEMGWMYQVAIQGNVSEAPHFGHGSVLELLPGRYSRCLGGLFKNPEDAWATVSEIILRAEAWPHFTPLERRWGAAR